MGANINDLLEELREPCRALVNAASAAGLQPRITSTFRSHAEQQRLYRRFLAGQQGFPVAPPGTSAHEFGEAFDMVVTPMDALADVGYTWQTWGGGWSPSDAIHFELPGASASHTQPTVETGSKIAEYINTFFLSIGPWWSPLSGKSLLQGGVAIEKKLGFDAAVDWFWRHVAVNPDAPK